MTIKHWLMAAAGVIAIGFVATSAGAAPVGGVAGDLKAAVGETSAVEQVHWRRRCWKHRGHWHCRRRHVEYYPYYYGGYAPYYYGGPVLTLRLGGHRHHRRHRRW